MQNQKPILFRRIESELMPREDSESKNESPQFSHYEPNVFRMIENIGYDLTMGPSLNFGKGRRTLLQSFVPKGKGPDYYHRTCRGLGYVSPQSCQPLSLKSHYTIIIHQARHRESQMSVSATSSKNFQ